MDAPTRHRLSDEAWRELAKVKGQVRSGRGRPGFDDRRFFEAACWILRTGAPWRDLPAMFGPWQATYRRFTRWSRSGIWAHIHHQMRHRLGLARAVGAIDSTSIRVHQHGAPPCARRTDEAVGISRGGKTTKLHLLAGRGRRGSLLSWSGKLTPGQTSDVLVVPLLLHHAPSRMRTVTADRAYDAAWVRSSWAEDGVRAVIPYRRNRRLPRAIDRRIYAKRNLVERLFGRLKHFRRVATRYDRLAVHFAGFVSLAFVASCVGFLRSAGQGRG